MDPARPHTFDTTTGTLIQTLLLCDLVDSTRLVERVGDERAAEIFRRHDVLARDLITAHEGYEVDKTDGFLLLFARPIQAVAFALAYHRALKTFSDELGVTLAARVGIHLGEVVVRPNAPEAVARGAKPVDVDGLAKPMAARLMGLAGAGQTLLSRSAFALASRASVGDVGLSGDLQWIEHGPYRFKGVEMPARVFEVGSPGEAPLAAPANTDKARRVDTARSRRWLVMGAVLAVAAVIGYLALGAMKKAPGAATLDFSARDWIVLGTFENHTGDVLLDNSLSEAFRLGLEQSRYANVLLRSQVRRALRYMELDANTSIDRDVGSRVAMREGASAVILGEITDVGRAFSLKAEILHPASGNTIYTETALAPDRDSILTALEEVIVGVRSHLGESLSAIEGSSVSLEQVTTANLEALKAYSLGIAKIAGGKHEDAIQLLERAVEQDAGFAMAHAKLGTTYNNFRTGDPRALHHWQAALASSDRLTEREKLYVEGCVATRGEPAGMRRVWYLMSTLYPDQAVGHHNLGSNDWYYENNFVRAAEAFEAATEPKHPWNFATHHHLGYMRLAFGEPERALASFKTAWDLEPNPLHSGMVDALVMLGRYEEAEAFVASALATPTSHFNELETRMREIGLLVSRGQLQRGLEEAESALARAETLAIRGADGRARAAMVAVLERMGDPDRLLRALTDAIAELDPLLDAEVDQLAHLPVARLGLLGKISARNGQRELAEQVLARIAPRADDSGFHAWQTMADVLRSEVDLLDGMPAKAIRRLEGLTGEGVLFQVYESLARAYEVAGRRDDAVAAYRWLVAHRGQGIAEWLSCFYGQTLNRLDADVASFHLGRLLAASGRVDQARVAYQGFLDGWPLADPAQPLVAQARAALVALPSGVKRGGS